MKFSLSQQSQGLFDVKLETRRFLHAQVYDVKVLLPIFHLAFLHDVHPHLRTCVSSMHSTTPVISQGIDKTRSIPTEATTGHGRAFLMVVKSLSFLVVPEAQTSVASTCGKGSILWMNGHLVHRIRDFGLEVTVRLEIEGVLLVVK